MKILVFSDSHGRTMRMIEIIEDEKPDMLFHLGDMVDDTVDLKVMFPKIPLVNVCGNNDWMSNAPGDRVIEAEGTKFFLTHGHRYGVRRSAELVAKAARAKDCQVALYGHTHIAKLESACGIIAANPGSITLPYRDLPSYLSITVESGCQPQLEIKYADI